MSWIVKSPRETPEETRRDRSQQQWSIGFDYGNERIYETRYGISAAQVADEFQRDMEEAERDRKGWWDWKGNNGTSLRRIRVAFIAGFEVRPVGGKGTWSG